MLLYRQEGLDRDAAEKVNRTTIAELNIPDHPTAHGSSQAKQFLRVALQLSHTMKVYEVSFVAELMAQFIDGDEEIRYGSVQKETFVCKLYFAILASNSQYTCHMLEGNYLKKFINFAI